MKFSDEKSKRRERRMLVDCGLLIGFSVVEYIIFL